MTKNRSYHLVYALLALLLASMACASAAPEAPTPTQAPTKVPATNTPLPTSTPKPTFTPKPTSTPRPTATLEPTPAPIGETVTYGSLEITLLKVTTHDLIVPGGLYYWYSKPGETFIDLGVHVKNLDPGNPVSILWGDIYILDVNGDTWYANFGDFEMVESGAEYDPYNIGIGKEVTGGASLKFENDTYLRLVYYTQYDPEKPVFFGIENSPQMRFIVKK